MIQLSAEKEQAVRYFLGELSENEQNAIEERFFINADYSRFLDSVENDLISDYVSGILDFRQTQNFERNFLISARRREAVRLAHLLPAETFAERDFFPIAPAAFHRWFNKLFYIPNLTWTGILAAIVFLILTGGLWLFDSPESNQIVQVETTNPIQITGLPALFPVPAKNKSSEPQAIQKISSKTALKPNLEKREKQEIAPHTKIKQIPALILPPLQSAEKSLIVRACNAESIRLRVKHSNVREFIKYRIEIQALDGDLIWSREIAVTEKTLQKPLVLDVRSGALNTGTYELTLSGITSDRQLEEVNFYNFKVRRK